MDTVTSKPPAAPVDVPAIVRSIPRHRFAAPELHPSAYRSQGPSMSEWQGIPPDRLVTKMVEGLEIDGESRVLEFGADLGFTAAVLGRIADVVYAVRQDAERRAAVRRRNCKPSGPRSLRFARSWPAASGSTTRRSRT